MTKVRSRTTDSPSGTGMDNTKITPLTFDEAMKNDLRLLVTVVCPVSMLE